MFDFDAFQKMKALAKEAVDLCRERVPTQRDRIAEDLFEQAMYDVALAEDKEVADNRIIEIARAAYCVADLFILVKNEGKKKCKCSDVK